MTVGKHVWGYIVNRDHRIMQRMNNWSAPRWIRFWMLAATRMGDGWLWYSLGAILLAFGGARGYAAVGAAGSAAILGIFVFKALKQLSRRPLTHMWRRIARECLQRSSTQQPSRIKIPDGTGHGGVERMIALHRSLELAFGDRRIAKRFHRGINAC